AHCLMSPQLLYDLIELFPTAAPRRPVRGAFRTQPLLVTLSKPGIPPDYGFLLNESHLVVSRLNT
ncbi:MAG: hypothetical protein ACYTX0_60175, partial [Nostoc sp.]